MTNPRQPNPGHRRKRVLVLATTTGYQTRSFADAAERLGIELAFATDRCHVLDDPWGDAAIPVRFHEEDASARAIADAHAARPFDGIVVVGDRPTVLAALAARALGLRGHPPEAAEASRNKLRARQQLAAAGLPAPWFRVMSIGSDPRELAGEVSYPCVVKPLALSGSRGVIRADDPESFVAAFARLKALLSSVDVRAMRDPANDVILVEGFIEGREFALEGLLDEGRLRTLALFDKPDPLDGPFFEETIYVTPSSEARDVQQAIGRGVAAAAAALGLVHGPIHAECRVNDRGVFVLEVAARPIGGLCARCLRFVVRERDAISLEELLLRHALGEDTSSFGREPGASGVMMVPIPGAGIYRGVEGVEDALGMPGVEEVRITAKPDQALVPLPEGASYLGFIFGRADSPPAVVEALRTAHRRLRFTIEPRVTVTGGR